MSLTLAAISAVTANAVTPITAARTRQQTDALEVEAEAAGPEAPTAAAAAAILTARAAFAPPAPLAPAVMQALISLQADAERDLPGLFEDDARAKARQLYARRRNLSRAA